MRRLFPLLMLFALAALLTGCEEKKKIQDLRFPMQPGRLAHEDER